MSGVNAVSKTKAEASVALTRIAVDLPDFWMSDPTTWFAHTESLFAFAGVNKDEIKYLHVVAKLDLSGMRHIADLVKQSPATGKYDAIKERLISRFEPTIQVQIETLLLSYGLENLLRPAHPLSRMEENARTCTTENTLGKLADEVPLWEQSYVE